MSGPCSQTQTYLSDGDEELGLYEADRSVRGPDSLRLYVLSFVEQGLTVNHVEAVVLTKLLGLVLVLKGQQLHQVTEGDLQNVRAPDKMQIFISVMTISSLNPMFDHLLESSRRDDSNKWSNIGFDKK